MKTIRLIGIVLLTMLMSVCYSACGDSSSDDESNNSDKGGGEKPSTNKLLVKETVETEYSTHVTNFTYDNKGRLIQYNYIRNASAGTYSSTHNITYTENSILEVSNNGSKCEYTLENGLIVKNSYSNGTESWIYTYSYDSNNHLTTKESTNSLDKYTWNGGNLVRIEGYNTNRNDVTTYEYSSHLSPPNFQYKITSDGFGYVTHAGETSENLPSKITRTDADKGNILVEESYEWVVENGLPVKAITIKYEKSQYSTYTITYEWK